MRIVIEIVLGILLIISGYTFVCYYMAERRWITENKWVVKTDSRRKIGYLISAGVICGGMIAAFEILYSEQTLIHHAKSLTLVLMIYPMAVIDYRIQKIPNQLLLIALMFRGIYYIIEFGISSSDVIATIKEDVAGAIIIGAFFFILLILFKNCIGMGDIKLFMLMGLYQGIWGACSSVFLSLVVSFFLSIGLLITRKKNKKDTISFGPSILIGTVLSIGLFGI